MKKVFLVFILISCVSICFAQGNSFDDFKKLFKKVELPLVTDSCSIYAGSIEDDYIITNSVLYLVNYDIDGNIIDYIKVARCLFESGHSWFKINQHNIWYSSYEYCPVSFEYDEHKVIPMIESRLKYSIGTDGHFSKKEILFYRKGIYEPTYNGCYFEFLRNFPEE